MVAFAILAVTGDAGAGEFMAALIGVLTLAGAVGVFALMLRSDALVHRVGAAMQRVAAPFLRLARRDPDRHWDTATVRFRRQTIGLLRHRWLALTAGLVVAGGPRPGVVVLRW